MNEQDVRQIIREELSDFLGSDKFTFQKKVQFLDEKHIQTGKATGTKIGTDVAQKIGFWNADPVIQYIPTGPTAGFVDVGTGTEITEADTFTGNFGTAVYNIGDIVASLKKAGIIQKDA